jgi:hypothetical protein
MWVPPHMKEGCNRFVTGVFLIPPTPNSDSKLLFFLKNENRKKKKKVSQCSLIKAPIMVKKIL